MSDVLEIDDAVVLLLGAPSDSPALSSRIEGITRLEKLLFLLERETSFATLLTEDAEFRSDNFGPLSVKAYQAVDLLVAAGLANDSADIASSRDDTWESQEVLGLEPDPYATRDIALTDLGRKYYAALLDELPPGTETELAEFKDRFATLPLRQLIRYVYKRYPEYTDRSLIRDSVLGD